MSFRRIDPDHVEITLTQEQFDELTLALGYACGALLKARQGLLFDRVLRLVNTINDGNPNYTPYQVTEDAPV